MEKRKSVMISSTINDLPEHRKEVMDACLRQGMFPIMMEHLPAIDAEAIKVSLKMVDDADIYVGIFAHRYGYVPKGHEISVTEMEYNRAVERGIPRCIFIIHEDHTIKKAADIEIGDGGNKLEVFKKRLLTDNIVNFYKSPADLRAHVINSLSTYHQSNISQFHYVSDIPTPPKAYIAHPYTLLQTHKLIGRKTELDLLTNWVSKRNEDVYQARILNFIAIGGMGKSALTWLWFNDIAPRAMKPLAGQMWWSFYESDATFENFVIRALAYVTQKQLEEVKKIAPSEREAQLLSILDHEPYLIVLDGLERILLAYARMDAAHLSDDDIDQRTANFVAKVQDLPEGSKQTLGGQKQLRKTADPRAGSFLRKLANVRNSRILVSSRLYPADLQTLTGEPLFGCFAIFLQGLDDNDSINLWHAFNAGGAREILLPMFHKFENHPLLIQSLASEVSNYRHAPSNFDRWQKDHPDFNPFNLSLANTRAHVLEFALHGLDNKVRKVLETISAFRMPANYGTLVSLFVGKERLFPNEPGLDSALQELEDRGLVGWDKHANRYDLHPIVRGVVWSKVDANNQHILYTALLAYFDSLPKSEWAKVHTLDDLQSSIELYNVLVGLKRYNDAYILLRDKLEDAVFYRLGQAQQQIMLIEMLFFNGLDQKPKLEKAKDQSYTFGALARAYQSVGKPEYASLFYKQALDLSMRDEDSRNAGIVLRNLSNAQRLTGNLYDSEASSRDALLIAWQGKDFLESFIMAANLGYYNLALVASAAKYFIVAASLGYLGLTLAVRGANRECELALQQSLRMFKAISDHQFEGTINFYQAQHALWMGNKSSAQLFADRAWELAQAWQFERDLCRVARIQGTVATVLNDFGKADERLRYSLVHARKANLVEEEIPSIIALAGLQRLQRDLKAARELLDDVWEPAERGPYPLVQADALNLLAQIESDSGNTDAAKDAATKAYQLSWCDGEPYSYHWGLEEARQQLRALGAPEPDMPKFDSSKHEPMPDVEINFRDESYFDEDDMSHGLD